MVNQDASQKFVKQGLTFDDVLLIRSVRRKPSSQI